MSQERDGRDLWEINDPLEELREEAAFTAELIESRRRRNRRVVVLIVLCVALAVGLVGYAWYEGNTIPRPAPTRPASPEPIEMALFAPTDPFPESGSEQEPVFGKSLAKDCRF